MTLLIGTLGKGKSVDEPKRVCWNCGAKYDDWTGKAPCPECKEKPKEPPQKGQG